MEEKNWKLKGLWKEWMNTFCCWLEVVREGRLQPRNPKDRPWVLFIGFQSRIVFERREKRESAKGICKQIFGLMGSKTNQPMLMLHSLCFWRETLLRILVSFFFLHFSSLLFGKWVATDYYSDKINQFFFIFLHYLLFLFSLFNRCF